MIPSRVGPDVELEALETRHAPELFRLTERNREHLRRWLPWVDGTRSVEDTQAFIVATSRQLSRNNGSQSAIRYRGDLVGVVGQHGISWGNRSTSLGYWLAHEAQGKGIMTRACEAYLTHTFGELGLHRVEIRCAVGNTRSRAIPERLGFRLEGFARDAEWLYDHFVDHAVYALLAPEWPPSTLLERREDGA